MECGGVEMNEVMYGVQYCGVDVISHLFRRDSKPLTILPSTVL
jgi:hypothetical protein